MYRIYSPRVNQLMSIYGSAGLVNTDLSLKKNDIQINADYMSYNFQGDVSVSRTMKSQRLLRIYEFAVDGLYNYQNGHTASSATGFLNLTGWLQVKPITKLQAVLHRNLSIVLAGIRLVVKSCLPLLPEMWPGSLSTSCGGRLGLNVTRPFKKGRFLHIRI